jgi:hypothetical protein
MKRPNWIALAAATVGAVGIGLMAKNFLPQRFRLDAWYDALLAPGGQPDSKNPAGEGLLEVEVSFLRWRIRRFRWLPCMMALRNSILCVYQLPGWLHLIDELY